MTSDKTQAVRWTELLAAATAEPGILGGHFTRFHDYSMGNVILAYCQCQDRGIKPGPLASYGKWKELGRQVRLGQKALMLLMPVQINSKTKVDKDGKPAKVTIFVGANRWFVYEQTDGAPLSDEPVVQGWDTATAAGALGLTVVDFDMVDGNCQGYADTKAGTFAVSPVAAQPVKVALHEIAHCLMHDGQFSDGVASRGDKEAEAEAVAMLVSDSLGMTFDKESRGYIQHWLKGGSITEPMARHILTVADKVLRAGRQTATA